MSKKSVRPATRPQSSSRQAAADLLNQAFKKSDFAEICHAIAAATTLYNISDLAQKSGLARQNIYRSFADDRPQPKFTTVLSVLDAMVPVTFHDAPGRIVKCNWNHRVKNTENSCELWLWSIICERPINVLPRKPGFLRKIRDIVQSGGGGNGVTNFGEIRLLERLI